MKNIALSMFEHYEEALNYFKKRSVVGLFLQGSQNYSLHTENSDIDTKLIVLPTFEELVMNKSPISTTHIRENEEHIDFKDIRLYMETFRKQNLNFVEILFTDYYLLNESYAEQWDRLIAAREKIARMNPARAVKSMAGLAETKYKQLQHDSPAHAADLAKYGYSPKELHHLLRIEDFLDRYINEEDYKSCMTPINRGYLIDVKKGKLSLNEALDEAWKGIGHVRSMADSFLNYTVEEEDSEMRELLDSVKYEIMKIYMKEEMKNA